MTFITAESLLTQVFIIMTFWLLCPGFSNSKMW